MSEAGKVIIIKFRDGRRFSLPAAVVADARADYYDGRTELSRDELIAETLNGSYDLLDWLLGDMDWSDVEPHVTELPSVDSNLNMQGLFLDAEFEVKEAADE